MKITPEQLTEIVALKRGPKLENKMIEHKKWKKEFSHNGSKYQMDTYQTKNNQVELFVWDSSGGWDYVELFDDKLDALEFVSTNK